MVQKTFMERALEHACAASERGEAPVGAVLVNWKGEELAAEGNRVEEHCDPTAHAEMLVLRAGAEKLGTPRLLGCALYVTLEPCPMCAQAISLARIGRLYFGASDPKGGGVENGPRLYSQPTCHHQPEVYGGINETRASDLLKAFFSARR